MEAASARYAAHDRWGDMGYAPSQLQRFIQTACSPDNFEPNLALNLEVADLINSKKGSAPREAAVAIVNYINHRNPNVALLALNLLDICVKNCGYPFHLQISTKEFLNELVRRFPERPPIRPTRVQVKILEAIEEWRGTICETSRYKEDLGFIRDMHRLLSYKGYVFPEVRREDAAVLNASDILKSAEEMEEEEREAQSAKLQELIRRGTQEDLQEANRLMKIMAGYDTRSQVDYRAKAAEEVSKVQQKARLLEERLESFGPNDKMTDDDVFSELAASLHSAQPKIRKMCEESDDHEAVAKLVEIHDSIHRTVERYKLMKKGEVESANKIARGATVTMSHGGGGPQSPANQLSLIDLDDAAETNNGAPAASSAGGVENDLLGLALGEPSNRYGQTGSIALGFGANTYIPGPALLSSVTKNITAKVSVPTPPPGSSSSPFTAFSSAPPASQTSTPQPPASMQSAFAPPSRPADPFAALASPSFQPKSLSAAPPPPAAHDEDEWSFSSALPPETPPQPREHRLIVSSTSIKIEMVANRSPPTSCAISLLMSFTNNTAQSVSDLHFELAVTRGYDLCLKPQTGRNLAPKQSRGVTQSIEVWRAGDKKRKVEAIKMRWRLSYKLGVEVRNEMGEISEFQLA